MWLCSEGFAGGPHSLAIRKEKRKEKKRKEKKKKRRKENVGVVRGGGSPYTLFNVASADFLAANEAGDVRALRLEPLRCVTMSSCAGACATEDRRGEGRIGGREVRGGWGTH